MSEEKQETGAKNVRTSTIAFTETAKTDDLHDDETDKNAIEAEILSETKTIHAPNQETPTDEFSQFLANLPEDADIKLIVTRLADRNLTGQFRLSCPSDEHTDTIYWNGETEPSEIYAQITKAHGGGRYRLQIRGKEGFQKNATWTITLADPSKFSDKELLLKKQETKTDEQPRTVESSQVFANPIPIEKVSSLKDVIAQLQDLKDLQAALAPPAAPAAEPVDEEPRITKDTIKMMLIEKSLDNPNLLEKALEAVFDIEPEKGEKKPVGFWASIAGSLANNPKIADMLINGVTGIAELGTNFLMKPAAAAPVIGLRPPPMMPPQTPANAPILQQPEVAAPPVVETPTAPLDSPVPLILLED